MICPTKCIIFEYRMVNDNVNNNTRPEYLAGTRGRQLTVASAFFKIKDKKEKK